MDGHLDGISVRGSATILKRGSATILERGDPRIDESGPVCHEIYGSSPFESTASSSSRVEPTSIWTRAFHQSCLPSRSTHSGLLFVRSRWRRPETPRQQSPRHLPAGKTRETLRPSLPPPHVDRMAPSYGMRGTPTWRGHVMRKPRSSKGLSHRGTPSPSCSRGLDYGVAQQPSHPPADPASGGSSAPAVTAVPRRY